MILTTLDKSSFSLRVNNCVLIYKRKRNSGIGIKNFRSFRNLKVLTDLRFGIAICINNGIVSNKT